MNTGQTKSDAFIDISKDEGSTKYFSLCSIDLKNPPSPFPTDDELDELLDYFHL